MNTGNEETDYPLGKWTATLFYVSHKKCLLITNSMTRYTVIVDRVTAADFSDLSGLFARAFYDQLLMDGIKTDWEPLQKLFGKVELFTTDNDRKLIGTQNSILQNLEDWKYEFGDIDHWPFREINRRINVIPYREPELFFPREKMKMMLDEIYLKL
jgi:hypothetical protein